jgi:hypothetical protein
MKSMNKTGGPRFGFFADTTRISGEGIGSITKEPSHARH